MNRSGTIFFAIAFFLTMLSLKAGITADYDDYGGWKKRQGARTGFFHTQKISGKWWLVSPEGNVFFSKGVNSVHPSNAGSFSEKASDAVSLLRGWGMNTAGCWSDPELRKEHLPVAIRIKITDHAQKEFPDVFDAGWRDAVTRNALAECAPYRNDPWVLGYFTDNELPWKHGDKAGEFVDDFLRAHPSGPGSVEAQKAKAGGPAMMDAFREKAAEIYFKTTAEALRKADPNHLILGCRFAGKPPLGVVGKMKGCADVISINNYMRHPPVELLRQMSEAADLPVMVTEFSFKAPAADLATNGSGPEMASQSERAKGFEEYAGELIAQSCCVGYHWFKYAENWQGIFQSNGVPFPELTKAFGDVNGQAELKH